ncbi:MAG: zinc metalloprotease HtpX [Bacteroidota bacterium]
MSGMKTAVLMALMMGLFLFVGQMLAGENGLLMAFFFSLVMNAVMYWFSDKLVLLGYRAREVSEADAPRFVTIVRRLSTQAGLPMPKVYVIPSANPNAFATGRNPQHAAVAATEGLLTMLKDDELEGVIAHELAHIRNRDILISTVVATMAGTITLVARMAMYASLAGGRDREGHSNPVGDILLLILAPIAAMLIQFAVSRSREFLADEGGAQISGKPHGLAGALRKLHAAAEQIPLIGAKPNTAHLFIVNPLSAGGMMRLFSTHPPVEERIARLEQMAGRLS